MQAGGAVAAVSRQWNSTHAKQSTAFPALPKTPFKGGKNISLQNIPATAYSTVVEPPSVPYSNLTVGVPRETFPNERRVAISPQNVALLKKKGFANVLIERDAGKLAGFGNEAYENAGATLLDAKEVWSGADILLKVRAPDVNEIDRLKEGATIISMLQPAQNKDLVERLAAKKVTSFAMDMIPRTISRAQTFDALSSMANTAGYKAVLEASNVFGRFLTGQVTAAGKIPPAKVLVIGCGIYISIILEIRKHVY